MAWFRAGRLGGAFGGFASGDGAFQLLALWAVTGGFFSLRFRSGWAVLVGGSGESEPRGPKSWATLVLKRRGAGRGISHGCTMFVVGGKAGSFLFDQNISEICLRGRPCIFLTSSVVGIRDSVGLWVQGSGEEAGWHQPSTLLLRGVAEGQLSSRVWCRGSVDHTGCRCSKKVPGPAGVFGPPLFYNFFWTAFVINVYFIYTIL